MARYIIEDNYFDKVEYDENHGADIHIINSVIKNLFGNYKLLNPAEEKSTLNRMALVLQFFLLIKRFCCPISFWCRTLSSR